MTDTPGTPGETPCKRTPGDGTTNPTTTHDQPTRRSRPSAPFEVGLASGETPLDKPRSFRDDTKRIRYGRSPHRTTRPNDGLAVGMGRTERQLGLRTAAEPRCAAR